MATGETSKSGWLVKNRAGQPWSHAKKRWIITSGFQVFYYKERVAAVGKAKANGHFDLRNVVSIAPAVGVAEGAVSISLAQGDAESVGKKFVISFDAEPAERNAWLSLWCSAIVDRYVDASLRRHIDARIASSIDRSFGAQPAVSFRRSIFTSALPSTKALTPREYARPPTVREESRPEAAASAPEAPQPPAAAEAAAKAGAGAGDAPPADAADLEVVVPDGVVPGDQLVATTPGGARVKVTVPLGAEKGTVLKFEAPKAEGPGSARQPSPPRASKPGGARHPQTPHPPTSEATLAAAKLQAGWRGFAARNDQAEQARLAWLEYHIKPDVMEWDLALELAVTDAERQMVVAARRTATGEDAAAERARLGALKRSLAARDFGAAEAHAKTGIEAARVLKARALAAAGFGACLLPAMMACLGAIDGKQRVAEQGAAKLESRRQQGFVKAVRNWEWAVAEVLAISAQEQQDVADSRERVAALQRLVHQRRYDHAKRYAITEDEIAHIEEHRKRDGPATPATA